ncbi:helix-turn-helix domain-containing protein [Rhizobacter sp. LjRoot28]|uniref:helix-turn-helix domain-containing protein n=1 Tax=Rhizobacter sp. LjRoot28 TaxID=3342309 RepID=UPI003ECE4D0D
MDVFTLPRLSSPDAAVLPEARDSSYVLGDQGFVYTGLQLESGLTVRHPAVLLLSADGRPFNVGVPGEAAGLHGAALLVPPRVVRSLDARGVPLLSFNIMPSHPAFHVFRAMQHPGVRRLDADGFNHLRPSLVELVYREATAERAGAVFDQAVSEAVRQLPPARPPDMSALEIVRQIDADPTQSLEALASANGQTPQALARRFAAAVGMPFREYQNWIKQRRVYEVLYSRRSLTQVALAAGFADSPQFARMFRRWYGQSPSYSRDPKRVRIVIHPNWRLARP